jgi:oxygen-independent coproporphyrinogen-3 oxidase
MPYPASVRDDSSLPAGGRGELPGIYVHVPFCSAICPYCDFAVTTPGGGRRRRYLPALLGEIEIIAGDPWRGAAVPPAADTIYLGGGTPSLLAPDELAEIVASLTARLDLAGEPWLGLEANPEDVTPARLDAWRRLGVRFLSLGVQSFDDVSLAFLGRRHIAAEARAAVAAALAAGIETVSVDLINGLPGQGVESWSRELEAAAALGPQHLSCYQLTVEAGTPFAAMRRGGGLRELPEEAQGELFRLTHAWLADHGFEPYEACNFAAAPAHRSRHNPKYWRHLPYLGLGPSAHSFDGRRRWWNHRQIGPWADAVARGRRPIEDEETLTAAQLALEELMLGLRTVEGVDLERFRTRHGIDLAAANQARYATLRRQGLLVVEGGRLHATPNGLAVADGLARALDLAAGGERRLSPAVAPLHCQPPRRSICS